MKTIFKISQIQSIENNSEILYLLKRILENNSFSKSVTKTVLDRLANISKKDISQLLLGDIFFIDSSIPKSFKSNEPNYSRIIKDAIQFVKSKQQNSSVAQEKPTQVINIQKPELFSKIKLNSMTLENGKIAIEAKMPAHDKKIFEAAKKTKKLVAEKKENKIVITGHLTKDVFENFLLLLEENGIDTSEYKYLISSLEEESKLIEKTTKGQLVIKISDKSNWDFIISISNLSDLDVDSKEYIKKSIMSSFVGFTDDKNLERKEYKVNRCPLSGIESLNGGYYVRGMPAMFSKFMSISKNFLTEESYANLEKTINEYGALGKFFNGRTGQRISPQDVRYDGALDISQRDFSSKVKELARRYLEGELIHKGMNPQKDSQKFASLGLYDEQMEGVKFLYTRSNAILADETGLGKTVQLLTAGELRLRTDTKNNNEGKRQCGIIVTKNAVTKDAIRGLKNMVPEQDAHKVWGINELFEWMTSRRLDTVDRIMTAPTQPPFVWCVINYEKFSIPPFNVDKRIDKIREVLASNQLALTSLISQVEQIKYNPSSVEDDFNRISEYNETGSRYLWNFVSNYFKNPKTNKFITKEAFPRALARFKKAIENIIENQKINASRQIQRLIMRDNVEISQKELMDKILDPKTLPHEREEAEEEWEKLEQERIRYKEGGKRVILTKYLEHIAKAGHLSLVILDELHSVKNGDPSNRDLSESLDHDQNFTTFNIQEVTENVPNVWGSSATVVANKPIDLFNQLRAVNNPLGYLEYDSFETSLSTSVPGMSGPQGTARAIRDNLVMEGVMLQRSKTQIWNKEKARELILIIKEKTGIQLTLMQSFNLVLMLQKHVDRPMNREAIEKGLMDILKLKTKTSYIPKIIDSIMSFDENSSPIVSVEKTLVSAGGSVFDPWHPRQYIKVSDTDSAISPVFLKDFWRRIEQTIAEYGPEVMKGRNAGKIIFTHYKYATAKAKVPYSLNEIKKHIQKGERVGVFTASTEAQELLASGINQIISELPERSRLKNKKVAIIKGHQKTEERDMIVSEFKKDLRDSPYAAIIIQIAAGGTGISLENTADWSIFNDLPISVAQDEQALGRFYRINTIEDVVSEYIVSTYIQRDINFWQKLQRRKIIAKEISTLSDEDRLLLQSGLTANNERRKKLIAIIESLKAQDRQLEKETVNEAKEIIVDVLKKINGKKANIVNSWYKIAQYLSF